MQTDTDGIAARLDECRPFLAYVGANALLHDADKLSAAFLRWSLANTALPPDDYPGHPVGREARLTFLQHHLANILPWEDGLEVPFPWPRTATEPTLLRRQAVVDLMAAKLSDPDFIACVNKSPYEKIKKVLSANDEEARQKAMAAFFGSDFTPILDDDNFAGFTDDFTGKYPWCRPAVPGSSLYDFYQWHHEPAIRQKTAGDAPTAVNLFTSGTAGLDGFDTGYETEPVKGSAREHHHPVPGGDKFLLATPFGFERQVSFTKAEKEAAKLGLAGIIKRLRRTLKDPGDSGGNPLAAVTEMAAAWTRAGEQTIIRTGRPINDITLADHSLSTAALAAAHAARTAMETANGPDNAAYALPLRAKLRPENSDWPTTAFAIFTCAVNTGRLDEMALDLKDIAAIRQQLERLLDHFITVFTQMLPVGGLVYRDQHGAHLVVPVLGDPQHRWLQVAENNACLKKELPEPNWLSAPSASVTNDEFVGWLLETAREELRRLELDFGDELLILLRHAKIGDELNRLAEAIAWSRAAAHLDTGRPPHEAPGAGANDCRVDSFHHDDNNNDPITSNLCPVCGRRPTADREKKCTVCQERVRDYHYGKSGIWREMPDLKKMAAGSGDRRLALLSVALDLSPWLGEPANTGIFCYDRATKQFSKKPGSQRYNSFGRLRRIWRSSQQLLTELHAAIPSWSEVAENSPLPVRTILLQPQDLQVILPAERTLPVIDQVLEKFHQAFGRVAGRVAMHVSVLVFPFRTPIYLVLDASRRLARVCLEPKPKNCQLEVSDTGGLWRREKWKNGGQFAWEMEITTTQEHQPPSSTMKDKDQFHANIHKIKPPSKKRKKVNQNSNYTEWLFAGNLPEGDNNIYMVRNYLSLAEVSGGLILDELSTPAANLRPSRCHSLPLEYWSALKELWTRQQPMAGRQRRRLRAILANRERLWDPDDPARKLAIELLWRDPGRLGSSKWNALDDHTRQLLIDSCGNGALFLGGLVEKRLMDSQTQQFSTTEKGEQQ